MVGQNIQSASVNFLYPGRKNDDSVLEISLLRSKHSERGTTSLVRIASIIKAKAEKKISVLSNALKHSPNYLVFANVLI